MDVHCSTCGEPWDTWHLWQDAIYETPLDVDEADPWRRLPRSDRLNPHYRRAFEDAGWIFGGSILDVHHCSCCAENTDHRQRDPEKVALKAAIVELFGDDEDAIAAAFEEEGL